MLQALWRSVMAPRLARRLAPRVAELLRQDEAFRQDVAAGGGAGRAPAPPPAPAPASPAMPEQTSSLQIFRGYDDADLPILHRFAEAGLHSQPGFIVDFMGGRTRLSELFESLSHLDGAVLGIPVPGDFHAEAAEWLGVLKTVLTAGDRYVAMEWGAGWAPWLVAGGRAAQRLGIADIRLYGVEADPHHFEAMRQHLSDNGFPPERHALLPAAVGKDAGVARWPDEPDARNQWGARPVREGSHQDVDYLSHRVDRFIEVKLLEARELVLREPLWDMVHIDIQGWEGEVCRSCIDVLTERVRWVVIGVHSRIQDAELLTLFHGAGWFLEHEKPTQFRYRPAQENFEAMVTVDGIQVWRNTRLLPEVAAFPAA